MYGQKTTGVLGASVGAASWYMNGVTITLVVIALILAVRVFFTIRKKQRP
jgi:hypothetical protein